jgi:hypothetical protein
LVVVGAIVEALDQMKLAYPKISAAQKADLARSRKLLLAEKQ